MTSAPVSADPSRGLPVRCGPVADPGDLLACMPGPDACAWVRRGDGLVAWGETGRLEIGRGPERFEAAARQLAALFDQGDAGDAVRLPGSGPVAFISATFDPDADGSAVVIPRHVLGRRAGRAWRTVLGARTSDAGRLGAPTSDAGRLGDGEAAAPWGGPAQPVSAPGRIRYAGSTISEVRWLEAVDTATRMIRTGHVAKVVLARDLLVWSHAPLDPRALLQRLADRFPDCWTFACDGLVGATPELLVRRFGDDVTSLVLAGSAPRGRDEAHDAALAAALLASDKDRDEHDLAVTSVRDSLRTRCADVRAEDRPWLLRLANVQHLATTVRARAGGATALELAGALHPTAAVCGTPRDAAMTTIRRLEGMERGRYAGPVGWVDGRGDGELGIALRCAEVEGSRARLFAGAGIVAASLPEAELEETRLKLDAMQTALERPGAPYAAAHGRSG